MTYCKNKLFKILSVSQNNLQLGDYFIFERDMIFSVDDPVHTVMNLTKITCIEMVGIMAEQSFLLQFGSSCVGCGTVVVMWVAVLYSQEVLGSSLDLLTSYYDRNSLFSLVCPSTH